MSDHANVPDDQSDASGDDVMPDAEDTSSGGTPDQPWSAPKPPEEGDVQPEQ